MKIMLTTSTVRSANIRTLSILQRDRRHVGYPNRAQRGNTLLLFFCLWLFKYLNEQHFVEQIYKTGNVDANLIQREHILDRMARFMEIETGRNSKNI